MVAKLQTLSSNFHVSNNFFSQKPTSAFTSYGILYTYVFRLQRTQFYTKLQKGNRL